MSRKQLSWLCLVAGIAVTVLGVLLGTAAAINDAIYLKLLAGWAGLATLATILLGAAAVRGTRAPRLIAILFLGLTWAFGVDPAARLLHRLFS
jgi:hypothetical protein